MIPIPLVTVQVSVLLKENGMEYAGMLTKLAYMLETLFC